MLYGEFKAPKGVIKVKMKLDNDKISSISISGDFFMHPEETLPDLEETLKGMRIDESEILNRIKEFYNSTGVKTPMLEPEHWVKAIFCAVGERK